MEITATNADDQNDGGDPPKSFTQQVKTLAAFLFRHYSDQIHSTLSVSPDPNVHSPLVVKFAEFLDYDPSIVRLIFSRPDVFLKHFETLQFGLM